MSRESLPTTDMVIDAIVEANAPKSAQEPLREALYALCSLARDEQRRENEATLMRLRMPANEFLQ